MSTAAAGYDAQSGTMDFSLALVELKRGWTVRRRSWPEATKARLVTGAQLRLYYGAALVGPYLPTMEDLLALDWETAHA